VASTASCFRGASTQFGGAPNSHVSLVDAAMPGMLPVINGGLALPRQCAPGSASTRNQPGLGVRPQELLFYIPTCRRAIRSPNTSVQSSAQARWR